jgi:hypothetical protein
MQLRDNTVENVTFENIQHHSALKIIWRNSLRDAEVIHSFGEIKNALAKADQPIFIVFDLTANPTYPLLTTVHEALPAYRNDKLKEWLLIGNNWMARTIEGTLAKMTGKKNVRWFKSEADVLVYMNKASNQS